MQYKHETTPSVEKKFSKENVDGLISADGESRNSKDKGNKSYVDRISFTKEGDEDDEKEEEEEDEKEVPEKTVIVEKSSSAKKEDNISSITSGSKSIIVASTTNNNVIQNKVVATTTPSGLVRIAPRSSTAIGAPSSSTITTINTTTTAARTSNGKIIYLQRSTTVPARVPGTIASNTSTNSPKPTVAIHVIRTPDGSLVPVKGGKSINIPNVSQLAGKKIITTAGGGASGQMLVRGPIKTISGSQIQGGSTATTTTAVGSTIISSVEVSNPKIRQVNSAKSALANNNNGSTPGSSKMLMPTSSGNRQVMVSQNVVKLSPNTSGGQLKAIQIPGKSGLQYVRVLNNTSGITHKITTSETATTPKYTVVQQTKAPMKIMVKSELNDRDRPKMMTTVPTFRKINDVVIKPQDNTDASYMRAQKISQINSQIRGFSNAGDGKGSTSTNKYIVVPKSLIRSSVTSQNQKIMQQRQSAMGSQQEAAVSPQSPPPAKKLYSVLRPNTDYRDFKLKAKAEPVPFKPAAPTLMSTAVAGRSSRSSPPPSDDSSVTIRRKHCNCTKSQCLKLYCDCFANGEFCQDCNCKDCMNNLDNEDERQKAIRNCLERNPNSFKPKITAATNESDQRLHNKGCNCKRSGCLKNYCECYEAKIPCSSNCKCVGCRNVDDHPDLDMDVKKCLIPTVQTSGRVKRTYDDMVKSRTTTLQSSTSSSMPASLTASVAATATACSPSAEKQPCNFITQEVVDATIQCLIAQADECKKSALTPCQTEKMVMEELGRCLVEIIDFSIRNTDQN